MTAIECTPIAELANEVVLSDFIIQRTLNSGKFTVSLALCRANNQQYIFKTNCSDDNVLAYMQRREKRILGNLSHPNVIKAIPDHLIHFNASSENVLALEYAPYGDFFSLICESIFADNEKLVRTFFHQLIEGLEYIHSQGYAHLDLKPENLLLGKNFTLKIADFDLTQDVEDERLCSAGTTNYRAPEVLENNCKDFKAADIYAAAASLYTMLTGSFAFVEEENSSEGKLVRYDMFENDNEGFWEENEALMEGTVTFNEGLRTLLNKMWAKDATQRITIEEIKKNAWYNEEIYSQEEVKKVMQEMFE